MRVRSGSLLVALLFLTGCTSILIWAVHASSPLAWNEHTQVDLPLALDSRGRPAIPIQVLGRDFLALVDSGSAVPTMREDTANSLGLRLKSAGSGYRSDEVVQMSLGGASIAASAVFIGHNSPDTDFALGQELFSQAVVDMDFPAGRLSLIRPEAFTPPPQAPTVVGLRYSKPYVQLRIGEGRRTLCATIDTGFDAGLALSSQVVEELSLPTQPGKKVVYHGFGGKRGEAPALQPLPEITMAGHVFRDVSVIGVVPNESADCNNLIGAEILSRQRIIFDLTKKRLWLLPPESADDMASSPWLRSSDEALQRAARP